MSLARVRKNALYLVGNAKLKKDKTLESRGPDRFLKLLWPAAEKEFQGVAAPFGPADGSAFQGRAANRFPSPARLLATSSLQPLGYWQPPFEVTTPSTRKLPTNG